jgi:hypothetical protein
MKQAWRTAAAPSESLPSSPLQPHAARHGGVAAGGASGPGDPSSAELLRLSRVVKKLLPNQPGAMKLARRYGDALVCVRYRQDPTRTYRYTTIELVVDAAPVHRPLDDDEQVYVQIGRDETDRQRSARAKGARWDPQTRLWRMPRKTARLLKLSKRIVKI